MSDIMMDDEKKQLCENIRALMDLRVELKELVEDSIKDAGLSFLEELSKEDLVYTLTGAVKCRDFLTGLGV